MTYILSVRHRRGMVFLFLILLAFVTAWVLGGILSRKLWRGGRRWHPVWRLLAATSVSALWLAPSFLFLGPAILPFPAWGAIVIQPELFSGSPPTHFTEVPMG